MSKLYNNLNIKLRLAKKEDLTEILHLFAKGLFNYKPFPYRLFWLWKHENNPFGTSHILLALDSEKIVGFRAFIRWEFHMNGQRINAFRAVDTVTDPEYRGKGIFSKLTMSMISQLNKTESDAIIYNTPNKLSKPGYLKMGWQVLGRVPVYVKWIPFSGSLNPKTWLNLKEQLHAFNPKEEFETEPDSTHIHTVKSVAYLKWRYKNFPVDNYGLAIINDGTDNIYFFLKIVEKKYFRELRICDCVGTKKLDWNFIAVHATKLSRGLGCNMVSLMPSPENQYTVIRNRFLPINKLANIITIRNINAGDEFNKYADLKNWSFAMGDLELF